ncbi:hypothetical protein ACAF76_014350 [Brevibacillus sp. TJ4]|uniref:hypothetical protein n=1 Tax=Brevibacillus sp. TJ4 TaxID=3234853 RepID=UPI003BA1BE3F
MGAINNNQFWLNGSIAELIVFDENRQLRDDEWTRIQSYLSLKYGITLMDENGNPTDYVASDGSTTMWKAFSNSGYSNRITGIGRDDASGLQQKQSRSADPDSIVTIALGTNVAVSNMANGGTIEPDLSFFTFGDNAGSTKYTERVEHPTYGDLKRMERIFKVEKTNWQDTVVTLQVEKPDETDKWPQYLVVARDEQFSSSVEFYPMNNGKVTLDSGAFATGSFFTFVAPPLAPGGVTKGLSTWVDVYGSAVKDANGKVPKLQDLAQENRVWDSTDSNYQPYQPSIINFNPGVSIASNIGYFSTPRFGQGDTAREIFSVQISDNYTGFPWEFGSYYQAAKYGDGTGKKIQTSFFSTTNRDVTIDPNEYDLKKSRLLNIRSSSEEWAISLDGHQLHRDPNNTTQWSFNGLSTYYIGAGHFARFNGSISEVILYNRTLNDDERARVNSYLALKYGMTLRAGDGTSVDYVASNGRTMWNSSANTGYGNRITGIGKDSVSALEQKQSRSEEHGSLVTVALGSAIAASNEDNRNDIANDFSFFLFGDDNNSVAYNTAISHPTDDSLKRMERIYKVEKTNWDDTTVTLQVEKADGAAQWPRYLVVSDSNQFDSNLAFYELNNGKVTLNSDVFANGSYFTFAAPTPIVQGALLEQSITDGNRIILTFIKRSHLPIKRALRSHSTALRYQLVM